MSAASESHGSSRALARSSAVMASGTLVSRVLGLARMAVLAYAIGNLTDAANVWETANTIPNQIYLLIAAGVLNVLLLPQLTRAMTRGQEGQDFSDRLLTIAITVLAVGTVVFLLAAPLITKLNALEWAWGDPKLQLAILFAYLCIPQMLFYGLHTVMGQVLAAHHRFAAFMWSPALANIVQIIGITIFIRRYPGAGQIPLEDWTFGMIGLLAGSATLGIATQALVLYPAVRAAGFRWRPRWGFRGVGLGTAGVMALWAFAEISLSQTGMLVVSNLLNWAVDHVPDAPGRNAYFYAFSVFMLPHSLLALSLLTAIYPVLSKAAAAGDLTGMAHRVQTGMRMLATAMVPIAIGVLLLAPLLVRVIYPASTPEAHAAIATILRAFAVGLAAYGLYLMCNRVCYSFEDARTPFLHQVGLTTTLMVVVGFAFLTQPPERAAVFAASGQALGQFVALGIGLSMVRRKLPMVMLRPVLDTVLRAVAASALALLPAWGLVRLLDRPGFSGALLTLGVAGVVYLAVYGVLALLLGVGELRTLIAPVLRRVPGMRRFAPAGAEGIAEAVATPATSASSPESAAPAGTLGWDGDEAPTGGEDDDMDRLEVGTLLGERYALEELLAEREGGGLQYWSARDATLGRLVAVTALPSSGDDADLAQAVLDGARRVASVDDARLVRVLDVGDENGICWIVEEGLTEAESLASLVSEHPLPAEEVRRLVGETAAGLESARRRGLHHLYLNPHSVLRTTDGTVKISGVGVASALEGTDDVTADEASLIDAADLVSLLYTGLTGRWPGEELPGVRPARRLAGGGLPAPAELVAGVPGDLDALCRLVHGSDADLSAAPHTPGELARQLSPWPSEMVHGERPGELTAPSGLERRDPATDALSGTAGASAAATAARPTRAEDSADETAEVPQTYYRPGRDRTDRGSGDDDTGEMSGLLASGERAAREDRRRADGGTALGAGAAGAAAARSSGGSVPGPRRDEHGAGGLAEERGTGLQNLAMIAVILGILAGALLLGWALVRGFGGDAADPGVADEQVPATAPADTEEDAGDEGDGTAGTGDDADQTGAEEEADEQEGDEQAAAGAGGTVAIHGITSFDPEGDGNERNDLAPLAVDGDTSTEWHSRTYLSADWGSLKSGVGLILDLGEGATVSEVEVDLGHDDVDATLTLADEPTRADATELGSGEDLEGTWTVSPEEPATGRYLILWFDSAATTDEGEIVSVREITVR